MENREKTDKKFWRAEKKNKKEKISLRAEENQTEKRNAIDGSWQEKRKEIEITVILLDEKIDTPIEYNNTLVARTSNVEIDNNDDDDGKWWMCADVAVLLEDACEQCEFSK